MMKRRLIRNFDFYLLMAVIALCAVGTFTLYSACLLYTSRCV